MHLSPDSIVWWSAGFVHVNSTILFTWLVMAGLTVGSWLVTRRLASGGQLGPGQNILEGVITLINGQIAEVTGQRPRPFLPLLGTLFLFIASCNLLAVVPGFAPPTGSLSTSTALALIVMVAVPVYGIKDSGLAAYLRNYLRPTPLMLPFNVVGEFSRTLALAVRLFGNVMSGGMIGAILLALAPIFFPVVMQLFGLFTGLVQAYIFFILATVFIAAGMKGEANHGGDNAAPCPTQQSPLP